MTARLHALVRAFGGPRYAVALAVDAIGTGLLRPFLLLYGIDVLRLPAVTAGLAMTAGVVAGLGCTPAMGRWLDRGARSTAVAAAMLVRVAGTALLLAAPAGASGTWLFAVAALFLGIGNQAFPVAHAALVATVSSGRKRDAALAAGRSVRNGGLGLGALIATASLAGGAPALRALAAGTGRSYLLSAALAGSVRLRARAAGDAGPEPRPWAAPAPRMRVLLAANVVYAFCLNVPEVALPLVLVTQLHASPVWAAVVFVTNTVLVVAFQVPVTVWMSRFPRRRTLAISGVVLTVSYLGFLGGVQLGHGWAAPAALAGMSVLCTLGEIIYAGSSTALVAAAAPEQVLGRALARLQLSTGFGLAVSPAVITALAARGPAALWVSLAAATLLAAAAVMARRLVSASWGRYAPSCRRRTGDIVFRSAEERAAARREREAEEARTNAALAEQQRIAEERRQREAFLASPIGLATAAREAGEPFFEIQIEVGSHSGTAGFGSTTGRHTTASSAATLGEIEKLGWRLEHASYYFMVTGETSTARVFVSGDATVVSGVTVGVYLFRNTALTEPGAGAGSAEG